jgi:UDPglucose 6-dehydrogenase
MVAKGLGMDRRIGSKFLHAGPGYGGSCFPKDTHALSAFARQAAVASDIVDATISANERQMQRMVAKIAAATGSPRGKTVGVLGLSFKPNTDDLRAAPALTIIAGLKKRGFRVRAFDPVAMENAERLPVMKDVVFGADAYDCARGAHALAIITEWNEFRGMDLRRLKRVMKRPVLCDLRNLYDPEEVERAGITHVGVGRGRIVNGRPHREGRATRPRRRRQPRSS